MCIGENAQIQGWDESLGMVGHTRKLINLGEFNVLMEEVGLNFEVLSWCLGQYYSNGRTASEYMTCLRFIEQKEYLLDYVLWNTKNGYNQLVFILVSNCDVERKECIVTLFSWGSEFRQHYIISEGKCLEVVPEKNAYLENDARAVEKLQDLAKEYNFNYESVENLFATTYIQGLSREHMAWVNVKETHGIVTFQVAFVRFGLPWCDTSYLQFSDRAPWKKEFKLTFSGNGNQTGEYQFKNGVFTRVNT